MPGRPASALAPKGTAGAERRNASLKVVTFESANPDYFLAHYGVGESTSRFGKPRWIEAATRLTHSNVLSSSRPIRYRA